MVLAALLLLAAALPTLAQPYVTNAGFKKAAADANFYTTIPLDGVMGVDYPLEAVHQTMKAAAKNPHIKHVVFMIDSESGWPLEHEHIGVFEDELQITAVVRKALAPAIFPAFFAENIYMTDGALIGNLPLHAFVARGSKEVTAKQVGIFSSMLASAAQSRGHADAIAYAMIDQKKDLHFWREGDKPKLSNSKPENTQSLQDYRMIRSALPGSVLTLDRRTAVEIGLAKPIDQFDAMIVGEYLGKDNWLPANQFGRVANEIGSVIAELEPIREEIREWDKLIPQIKAERNRSTEDEGYVQFKKNLDIAVDQIDTINKALEQLYKVHPERHTYFIGPEGQTVLADPAKWNEDLANAKREYGRANSTLRRLTDDFKKLGSDAEFLYDLNQRMRIINEHLNGIGRYGNAAYWAEHAKPDLPDDIYG